MSKIQPDIEIKELSEADIETIIDLNIENIPAWNRDHYIYEIKSERSLIYKAEKGREFAGFISVRIIADEIHLNSIGIRSEFRRHGVASELLDFIKTAAKKDKPSLILLEVSEKNLAAISFYEKKGFRVYGRRKKYYGDTDALLMQKELK